MLLKNSGANQDDLSENFNYLRGNRKQEDKNKIMNDLTNKKLTKAGSAWT